jgi:hypothetical protein
MILRSFYNEAFSITSKHDLNDQFFFARDSTYYGNVQITNYPITLFLFVLKYKLIVIKNLLLRCTFLLISMDYQLKTYISFFMV